MNGMPCREHARDRPLQATVCITMGSAIEISTAAVWLEGARVDFIFLVA